MGHARIGLAAIVLLSAPAGAAEVAILKSTEDPATKAVVEALRRSAPGHTFREHEFRGDRAAAARVVSGLRGGPAILVSVGPLASQVVREVAPESPLVFCMVRDPEALGLTPAPGLTGVALQIPVRNQLAAFRSVNPRGVRIGVVHGPDAAGTVAEAHKAAPAVRLDVAARPVGADQDVRPAVRALFEGPDAVDALWLPSDSLMDEEDRSLLLKEAARAGKPVYAFSPGMVEEGALVSNGPDLASIGERVAELVNRLAAGEREPIDIVYPQAELIINTKAAARLKIQVPPGALAKARKTY